MMRRPHAVLCCLLLLFAAACWHLIMPALDLPTQELPGNILSTLRATAILISIALCTYLIHFPRPQLTATDLLAAALFIGVTVNRFCIPGPAAEVKYDEWLQVAMLYVCLRVLFSAEPRTKLLLMMLLCVLGIYEGWIGIRQAYGFAYSNHGLFKVTGTLFNPGPYAGFIAPVFICAVACIVRMHGIAVRISRSWSVFLRQRPGVLLWGMGPYLLGWCTALITLIALPAAMSRAALIAVAVGGGTLLLREFGLVKRFRSVYGSNPLKTGMSAVAVALLIGGVAAGAYSVKRPSADGRLLMWKIDSRIMLHHPLGGVGLGNFAGAFGEEQATYFATAERSEEEVQVAGCPDSGFNEFLQFGAETGVGGFILLFLVTGTAIVNMIRRGSPFGYGLLTAAVFACFSYPLSVLPLRLLFVLLLAGVGSGQATRSKHGTWHLCIMLLLIGSLACCPGLYKRTAARVEARRQWSDVRVWINSERYDYLIEDGGRLQKLLRGDFRFLYDYGYALHKTGDYRGSNEILRQGMKISSDPMFWNIAGKNHEALGDFAAAEAAYLCAYNRIPDRIYPLYLLAKLYLKTGQIGKAYTTSQQAVGHTPKIESVQTREMQAELHEIMDRISRTEKGD